MNREKQVRVPNGWAVLPVTVAIFAIGIWLLVAFVSPATEANQAGDAPNSHGWSAIEANQAGDAPISSLLSAIENVNPGNPPLTNRRRESQEVAIHCQARHPRDFRSWNGMEGPPIQCHPAMVHQAD